MKNILRESLTLTRAARLDTVARRLQRVSHYAALYGADADDLIEVEDCIHDIQKLIYRQRVAKNTPLAGTRSALNGHRSRR